MDIGRAFGFVFEDERWVTKLLLGALISLIPIFGAMALLGYVIAIIRNVMAGHPRPLPEWNDLGQNFVDGLMMIIVNLVYALPIILVSCVFFLPALLPLLGGESETMTTILAGLGSIVTMALGCLATLYGLLLWALGPVLFVRYAAYGRIADCFQFGEVFRMLIENIGSALIAQLMMIVGGLAVAVVAGIVFSVIGVLTMIPICGWILGALMTPLAMPLSTWVLFFQGHLYGQVGIAAGLARTV